MSNFNKGFGFAIKFSSRGLGSNMSKPCFSRFVSPLSRSSFSLPSSSSTLKFSFSAPSSFHTYTNSANKFNFALKFTVPASSSSSTTLLKYQTPTTSSKSRALSSSSSSSSSSSHERSLTKELRQYMNPTYLANLPKNLSEAEYQLLTSLVLAVSLPVSLFVAPALLPHSLSALIVAPLDLAIGFAIPIHIAVGVGDIIEDYLPRSIQPSLIYALWALCALIAYGFLKINLCGPGISNMLKSLWRIPEKKAVKA